MYGSAIVQDCLGAIDLDYWHITWAREEANTHFTNLNLIYLQEK